MDEKITLLLESNRSQDRKKAVALLTQMGGAEALRTLAVIYKNDPDPAIKALALEAGKQIKNQAAPNATQTQMARAVNQTQVARAVNQTQISRAVRPQPQEPVYAPVEDEHDDDFKPIFVSPTRQQQSADMLQQAEDALENGDYPRAIDQVVKAFRNNPNYRIDSHAMNLALTITQMEKPDFLALLEDNRLVLEAIRAVRQRKQKRGDKAKPKRKFGELNAKGEKPLDYILLEFTGYFAVLVGMSVLFLLVASNLYYTAADVVARGCPGCTPDQQTRLAYVVQQARPILTYTPAQVFAYAMALAALLFAQLTVYYLAFHGVARVVAMSFEGSLQGMLDYCARFDILWQGLTSCLMLIAYALVLRDAFNPYLTPAMVSGTAFWEVLLYISILIFFGGWFWSISRRMTYYNIGCLNVTCAIFLTGSITSWVIGTLLSGVVERYSTALKALFT